MKEEFPGTSVGNASVAMPDTMKPFKAKIVVDRRFDPKKPPVLLKSFKSFLEGPKK